MTGKRIAGILFAVALLIAAGMSAVSAGDVSVDTIAVEKIDLYNLAVDEAEAGNYAAAMTHIDAAIAIDGNFTLAWVTKAGISSAKRDYTGALAAGEMAIAQNPEQADAWAATADALLNLGRYEEAIEAAETAITLNPDMIESYIIQGTAYGRMGEYKKMTAVSKRALEMNPDDLRAQDNLHFAQVNGGDDTESPDSAPSPAEKTPFPLTGGILGVGVGVGAFLLMSRGRFR